MSKSIVFDLEHTLIIGINWRVLHPEAKEVLAVANRDFDKTYLWTYCYSDPTISALEGLDILEYFSGVIGIDANDHGIHWTLTNYDKGKELDQKMIRYSENKNLHRLGDPREFVLIEDHPTYGTPADRIVEIFPYQGQQGHSLLDAYSLALKKF
jgi:hypothetical protein